MSAFARLPAEVGLSRFEIELSGQAVVKADLEVDLSEALDRMGSISELLDRSIQLGRINFAVGVLPVTISNTANIGSKAKSSGSTPTKIGMGATASASAAVGFRYIDTQRNNANCFCVDPCQDGICLVNTDCPISRLEDDMQVANCDAFYDVDRLAEPIVRADFDFDFRPLRVVDGEDDNIRPSRSLINLGPLLQMALYDLIPVRLFLAQEYSPKVAVGSVQPPSIGDAVAAITTCVADIPQLTNVVYFDDTPGGDYDDIGLGFNGIASYACNGITAVDVEVYRQGGDQVLLTKSNVAVTTLEAGGTFAKVPFADVQRAQGASFDYRLRVVTQEGTRSEFSERVTAPWRCVGSSVSAPVPMAVHAEGDNIKVNFRNPTPGMCGVGGVHVLAFRGDDLLYDEVIMLGDEGASERTSLVGRRGHTMVPIASIDHKNQPINFRLSLYYPSEDMWSQKSVRSAPVTIPEARRLALASAADAQSLSRDARRSSNHRPSFPRSLQGASGSCRDADVGIDAGAFALEAGTGNIELDFERFVDIPFIDAPTIKVFDAITFARTTVGKNDDMGVDIDACSGSNGTVIDAGGVVTTQSSSGSDRSGELQVIAAAFGAVIMAVIAQSSSH